MNIRSVRNAMFFCVALLLSLQLGAQEHEGTLVVVNRDGGSISFIDLPTGIEMARHPVGPRVPHELAISPNGRTAVSSEYGTGDNPGTKVLVFDVPSASLIGEIDLGPETRPHSFAFFPDGRRIVASMERAGAIAVIDLFDRRVIDTFAVGGSDNHMVRLSPDGNIAYVAGRGGPGTLSIIDLTGEREMTVIETGEGAEGLAVSPDGSQVWVGNRADRNVSVIDTRRRRVVDTIELEGSPVRVEISDGGRVVIPTGGAFGEVAPPGISIFDLETRERIGRQIVREAREGPGGFAINIVGEFVYGGDRAANSVLIFDLDNFEAPRVLPTGLNNPDGIVYSPFRMNVLTQ